MATVQKPKTKSRYKVSPRKGDSGPEGLRGFLARQEKDRLVDLLLDQALTDDRFLRKLTLEMAKGGSQEPPLAAIRRTLSAAFDPDRIYSYREVYSYADDLHKEVDILEDMLEQGHANEVIELAEYALSLTEEALEQVDDSDGDVYTLLERLQELHLMACKKARPEPEALARRLFACEMQTSWESFHGAVGTYAGLLGKKGLAVYRELAEAEWKKIPARKPGESTDFSSQRSRLASILEYLTRSAGDLEGLVAVKAHDLSRASAFLEIAEIYKEAGQKDLALQWAEKGVSAFPKQTDPRLRSFLAGEYKRRRRLEEAVALVWANFTDWPQLDSYQELKKYAEPAGHWPEWREKALDVLRDLARKARPQSPSRWISFGFGEDPASRLVEILLWEKEADEAWKEAQRLGCSEALWLTLAKLRERSHPEEALAVYQRQAESALQQVNQEGYKVAVARLRQVRDVMKRLGKDRELAAYLDSVRFTHKRKRNFLLLLNAAKLERRGSGAEG